MWHVLSRQEKRILHVPGGIYLELSVGRTISVTLHRCCQSQQSVCTAAVTHLLPTLRLPAFSHKMTATRYIQILLLPDSEAKRPKTALKRHWRRSSKMLAHWHQSHRVPASMIHKLPLSDICLVTYKNSGTFLLTILVVQVEQSGLVCFRKKNNSCC